MLWKDCSISLDLMEVWSCEMDYVLMSTAACWLLMTSKFFCLKVVIICYLCRQLWIFIWKKTDFVCLPAHGRKNVTSLTSMCRSFQQFTRFFTSEVFKMSMPFNLVSPKSRKLVWPFSGLWRGVEISVGPSSLQLWGTEDWCAHVLLDVHCIQRILDAAQNMPPSDKEVSLETYFHLVLSMVMRQVGK